MSNLNARFKKIKHTNRETDEFQNNVAEKFRKIELQKAISGQDGADGADGSDGSDGADGADGSSNPMTLGTRVSNTTFSQNQIYGTVNYQSSNKVEIGFLPDSAGKIVSSMNSVVRLELLRNGGVINSLDIKTVASEIVHYGAIKLYDLSPTGGSVSYTIRHNTAGNMQILNTYIYAKEV